MEKTHISVKIRVTKILEIILQMMMLVLQEAKWFASCYSAG